MLGGGDDECRPGGDDDVAGGGGDGDGSGDKDNESCGNGKVILEHLSDAEFLELQEQDSLREFEEDLEVSLTKRSTAQMESSRPVDQAEAEVEKESRFINNGSAPSRDIAGYDAGNTKDSLWAGGGTQQIPYGLCSAAASGNGGAEQGGGSWSGGDGGGGGREPEGEGEKGIDHPKVQSLIEQAVEAFRNLQAIL